MPVEYSRLLAEFPRFRSDVTPPPAARPWRLSPESVQAAVVAADTLFPMPSQPGKKRYLSQLWWWSTCGALLGPSLAGMLVHGRAPRWQWHQWRSFYRDDFWIGFQAQSFDPVDIVDPRQMQDAGAAIAQFLAPIADVVADIGEIRPAPLWAVVVDSVCSTALAAGNELMEPRPAALMARELVSGISQLHPVTMPNFIDIVDGQVQQWDEAAARVESEVDCDVLTHAERLTCCMIFHSDTADLCVSCPRRPRSQRLGLLAELSEQF